MRERRTAWGVAIGVAIAMFVPTAYAVGFDSGNRSISAFVYATEYKGSEAYFDRQNYDRYDDRETWTYAWTYLSARQDQQQAVDADLDGIRGSADSSGEIVLEGFTCVETHWFATGEFEHTCDGGSFVGDLEGYKQRPLLKEATFTGTLLPRYGVEGEPCELEATWSGGELSRGAFAYPEVRQHFVGAYAGASLFREALVEVRTSCLRASAPTWRDGGYIWASRRADLGAGQSLTPTIDP